MPKHPAILESDLICDKLAETLKDTREEVGMSQNQVAAKGSVSPQMVGYVEKRTRTPRMDIFARIALGGGRLPSEVMSEAERRAGLSRGADGELVFTSVN